MRALWGYRASLDCPTPIYLVGFTHPGVPGPLRCSGFGRPVSRYRSGAPRPASGAGSLARLSLSPLCPGMAVPGQLVQVVQISVRVGGASLCPDPGTRAVSSQLVQSVAGATSPGLCAYVLIPGLGAYVPTGGLLSGLVPVRSYDEGRFLSVRRPSRPYRGLRVTSGGSREPSAEDLRRRGRGLLPG